MASPEIQRIKQRYGIVGNCDALNHAIDTALKIAGVDLSVLIVGENGVGKEVFPRVIHDNSLRKQKKYFAVNCGAIPEGTIDSELFGHVKGAFTGAVDTREGYFSVANGGTLFLDEVGELPLATQARLLRVLETGEYIPVGSSEVKKTDVRIVAATNVDIEHAIHKGTFREDLYYRLNTIAITIPPLRERGRDIELLFRFFANEMSEKYHMPTVRLNEAAMQMLMQYSWPGNVRQLRNMAENMSVTSEERLITPELLQNYLPRQRSFASQSLTPTGEAQDGIYSYQKEREIIFQMLLTLRKEVEELKLNRNFKAPSQNAIPLLGGNADDDIQMAVEVAEEQTPASIDKAQKELIIKALERNNGHRKAAADELGISERTLYRKINEYGLE